MSEQNIQQQHQPVNHAAELAARDARIAQLEAELEENKRAQAVKEAVSATQSNPKPALPSAGAQLQQRKAAIDKIGGVALWTQLPTDTRLATLGHGPTTDAEIAESERYFGPASNSLAAARLQRQNPQRYSRLRAVYTESRED